MGKQVTLIDPRGVLCTADEADADYMVEHMGYKYSVAAMYTAAPRVNAETDAVEQQAVQDKVIGEAMQDPDPAAAGSLVVDRVPEEDVSDARRHRSRDRS